MTDMYEPEHPNGSEQPFAAPDLPAWPSPPASQARDWWEPYSLAGESAAASPPPSTPGGGSVPPPGGSVPPPGGFPLHPAGSGPLSGGFPPPPSTAVGGSVPPPGGFPPPPADWGAHGPWWEHPGWGYRPAGGPPPVPWYRHPLGIAGLIVALVGAGIGIGHGLWTKTTAVQASISQPGSSASGGSNLTNPFSGSAGSGLSPNSGSGGTSPFSGSGSGSLGSGFGSGSSGSLGTGSGSGAGSSQGSVPANVSAIAARVDPALVDINVTFDGSNPGAGTGIVLTSNGEILTNNHVVEGATSISVTDIGNGRTYGATVVGYDSTSDVAVVQLTGASGLTTARIGDSANVTVGQGVVAIGNAGGTGGTPTAVGGSITGLDQAITASDQATGMSESLTGLIETNADIQPGDSGGSMVDTSGRVIGMDTAAAQGFSLSAQASQGYAIPIAKALSIASQIESGHATSAIHVGPTAYLGVYISSAGSSTSPLGGGYPYSYGGQNSSPSSSGASVSGVVSGGPAAQAGLGQGDTITSVDGQTIAGPSQLSSLMQGFRPGQQVQVGWTDSSGAAHTTTITLGTGPAQ